MKNKSVFVCQVCGANSAKWLGKCPSCGEWNTLVEEDLTPIAAITANGRERNNAPVPMQQVDLTPVTRLYTGSGELDEVTGGGLVPGSLILLGGEPGIGKSTILLQMALAMSASGSSVLYVSGEESAAQVRMRAQRLGQITGDLLMLAETDLDAILHHAAKSLCHILIVDSIQTVFTGGSSSAPGSVSQVRQCGGMLMNFAKENNVIVILVGHVTKEGTLAGPRVLEHMVDTVLYFEGERQGALRLLRATKNRFGSTNEIGVFEMTGAGLLPISDPSGIFLAERASGIAGSAVGCVMQGTRPVLLEVQALCAATTFGNPRRLAAGIEYNRLLIIIAVLEKKLGLRLGGQDVYVNVTGGIRVEDAALDLAVAAAIVSAYRELPLPSGMVICGEIGLTGEIRHLVQSERRLKEAGKFGFDTFILPTVKDKNKLAASSGMKLVFCRNVEQSLQAMGLI